MASLIDFASHVSDARPARCGRLTCDHRTEMSFQAVSMMVILVLGLPDGVLRRLPRSSIITQSPCSGDDRELLFLAD